MAGDEYAEYDSDLIQIPEFQLQDRASRTLTSRLAVVLIRQNALKLPQKTVGGNFGWNIGHIALDIATNTMPENHIHPLDFTKKLRTVTVMDPRQENP